MTLSLADYLDLIAEAGPPGMPPMPGGGPPMPGGMPGMPPMGGGMPPMGGGMPPMGGGMPPMGGPPGMPGAGGPPAEAPVKASDVWDVIAKVLEGEEEEAPPAKPPLSPPIAPDDANAENPVSQDAGSPQPEQGQGEEDAFPPM